MGAPSLSFVEVGLKLALWEHPAPAGAPRALLLHGYLDTGRSFDALGAHLAPAVQALALDWRGHGESARAGPGGSYHLLDHLKDLAAVLRALDAQGRAVDVVVGHSMGGNVALMLAGALPDSVRRLVLLDALGPPPEAPEEQPARLGRMLQAHLTPPRGFRPVRDEAAAIARVRQANPGLSERGAARMVAHALVEDDDGQRRFKLDPRLRGPTPVRWPEPMWHALCARVTAKVIFARAERGYVPEGAVAAGRVSALGAAEIVVEGAHHHLHVEHPARVAEIVRGALD